MFLMALIRHIFISCKMFPARLEIFPTAKILTISPNSLPSIRPAILLRSQALHQAQVRWSTTSNYPEFPPAGLIQSNSQLITPAGARALAFAEYSLLRL